MKIPTLWLMLPLFASKGYLSFFMPLPDSCSFPFVFTHPYRFAQYQRDHPSPQPLFLYVDGPFSLLSALISLKYIWDLALAFFLVSNV
jgi:hypothetical protein